jgi:hypothetical protein
MLSIVSFKIARDLMYKKESISYKYLHGIISGVVDADRLDYASRDLLCSAVSNETIDYDRLFLHTAIHKAGDEIAIAIDVKALRDVEGFLKNRWRIFRDINYHHSVHKNELFMRRLLHKQSINALSNKKAFEQYRGESESVGTSPDNSTEIPHINLPDNNFIVGVLLVLHHLLVNGDNISVSNILLKLDDSWLDTVMKNADNDSDDENELLSGRTKYKTVLKRYSDFIDCDKIIFDKFYNGFKDKAAEIIMSPFDIINNATSSKTIKSRKRKISTQDKIKLDTVEKLVIELVPLLLKAGINVSNKKQGVSMHDRFLVNNNNVLFTKEILRILELFIILYDNTKSSPIDSFIRFYESKHDSKEVFIGAVEFKTGLSKPQSSIDNAYDYSLWDDVKGFVDIGQFSTIRQDLDNEKELLQPYHLYAKIGTDNIINIAELAKDFCDFSFPYIERFINDYTQPRITQTLSD